MNITKISSVEVTPYQPITLKKDEIEKKNVETQQSRQDEVKTTAWQKDILLSALDNLENKIQTANSHPLDSVSNAPIETNEEAMIELSFLNTQIYKDQAYDAQANINSEDVLSLFLETPELVA